MSLARLSLYYFAFLTFFMLISAAFPLSFVFLPIAIYFVVEIYTSHRTKNKDKNPPLSGKVLLVSLVLLIILVGINLIRIGVLL